jgi:hypothetical protein
MIQNAEMVLKAAGAIEDLSILKKIQEYNGENVDYNSIIELENLYEKINRERR